MKIKLIPTGESPDYYMINGESITAHFGDVSETYDLSVMTERASLQNVSLASIGPAAPALDNRSIIRSAQRVDGVLHVELCQQVGPGRWLDGDVMDAANYDPDAVHVVLDTTKGWSGTPWAKTRNGIILMTEESA